MLEEKKENSLIISDEELGKEIDTSLAKLPLAEKEQEIVNNIIEAPSKQELEEQFALFNMNQVKMNALRIIKLNNLLTKVEDQAIERFEKRPDQVSNKELLEYLQVISTQIERAQNFNRETLNADVGGIKIRNQKNEVNINIGVAEDKVSRENVMGAVSALLKQIQKTRNDDLEDNIIEVQEEKSAENMQNPEENIVYSNDTVEKVSDKDTESEI